MTAKKIKDLNFNVYNKQAQNLIRKFDKMGPRKFDIDTAFSLQGGGKNLSVLELGCFNGREFSYISSLTSNYLGIDISEDAIKSAKTLYKNGQFIVADFEQYYFGVQKFDIVFAFASMIHSDMETTKTIFNKLYKHVNNGGIIYISMKSADSYTEVEKTDEFGYRVYYHYSLNEYKAIGGELFEVVYEDQQYFNGQNWFTVAFKKR